MGFSPTSADMANALGAVFCSLLFVIVLLALFVVLFYRIFHRAGYNGWLGLLALIPGIGALICLCILAFDVWPAKKRDEAECVRCQLPGYGEGTFTPDAPPAPAPAPSIPAPSPAPPVVPDHPGIPDHPEVPDMVAPVPPAPGEVGPPSL